MPRSLEKERAKITELVRSYVSPIYDGRDDGRRLSVKAAAQALGTSRSTIVKHGLDEILRQASQIRGKVSHRRTELDLVKEQLSQARQDGNEWRERYERLLELHTRFEFHLRQHPTINVDELLAKPMWRALRYVPGGKRKGRYSSGDASD